jgi:hypothetical protein
MSLRLNWAVIIFQKKIRIMTKLVFKLILLYIHLNNDESHNPERRKK